MPRRGVSKFAGLDFLLKAVTYRGHRCLPWPYGVDRDGYGRIQVAGVKYGAHAWICAAVHGPQPSSLHEVAHNCGNAGCCTPKHLRWDTRKGNHADLVRHGTSVRGEKHGLAKLTAEDVIAIRASDRSGADLAREFGMSRTNVNLIRSRKRWTWL